MCYTEWTRRDPDRTFLADTTFLGWLSMESALALALVRPGQGFSILPLERRVLPMLFRKEVYPFAGLAGVAFWSPVAGFSGLWTGDPDLPVAKKSETQEVRYPLRRGPDL